MFSRHSFVIATLTLASLSGCSVTGIGASERAHSEEAALHKLLHNDDSFDSIYTTLFKRGYQCADQVTTRCRSEAARRRPSCCMQQTHGFETLLLLVGACRKG